MKNLVFFAPGMHCAGCAAAIRKKLTALNGVERVGINPISKRIVVFFDENQTNEEALFNATKQAGFTPCTTLPKEKAISPFKKWLFFIAALGALALFLLEWNFLPLPKNHFHSGIIQFFLALPAVIWGFDIYLGGLKAFLHRRPDMDFLVSLSTGTAFLYSTFQLFLQHSHAHYHFCAAAMVLVIVGLGRMLEERTKKSANAASEELSDLVPKLAHLIEDGKEKEISAELLKAGDLVLVKPGERVPCDGRIQEGISALDESLLTGESLPIDKGPGDAVTGGSLNLTGAFYLVVERTGDATTLASMIALVEEAKTTQPKVARLADLLSGYFAIGVTICALLTLALWWLLTDFATALPYALTVLVVACPCALGLATPAALAAGLGAAAKKGILYKDAATLEKMAACQTLFFDKTGTLTEGKPYVVGEPNDEVLALAASLEQFSEHPIAQAVLKKAQEKNLKILPTKNFHAIPGKGLLGLIDDEKILVGSAAFLAENGVITPKENAAIFVSKNGAYLGSISVTDRPRQEAASVTKNLLARGLECILLTGDNEAAAQAFAKEVPLSAVFAKLLPEDKLKIVRAKQQENKVVAMTGDGVNDAPALSQADVAISHYKGAGVAQSAAKVLLMGDDLKTLVWAFDLSRRTYRIIKQNLLWALFFNALALPLAAGLFVKFGVPAMHPAVGALLMSLSSLFVVSNALRLRAN